MRDVVDRLIHAPRREMGVVGVGGAGGVTGFEVNGPVYEWLGGARVRRCVALLAGGALLVGGGAGNGFHPSGAENADPMSESVSDLTCIFIVGAMHGTW